MLAACPYTMSRAAVFVTLRAHHASTHIRKALPLVHYISRQPKPMPGRSHLAHPIGARPQDRAARTPAYAPSTAPPNPCSPWELSCAHAPRRVGQSTHHATAITVGKQ